VAVPDVERPPRDPARLCGREWIKRWPWATA